MRAFVVLTALLLSACAVLPASAPPTPVAVDTPFDARLYHLAIGDRVKVDVYGEPDLSVETTLDSSGSINLPLLGRVEALGMTAADLEALLVKQLASGYLVNPSVRVLVTQFRPIYVVGQVERAGAYPYVDGLTVEKSIALAGGLTKTASERSIYILREATARSTRERARLDTLVRPGDTVIVEESLF